MKGSDQLSNTTRIAKNTMLLYVRMIFLMLVSLYTSRVILNALGVVDYGVYMVVGGFVAMFGIITNSLAAAISRYITFGIGLGNGKNISDIFSASICIQFIISFIVIVALESFGVWFLNTKLTIPIERLSAANWVFQLSILTFVVNLISVPYNACIIAYERMDAYAYIGIFQAVGNLCIAIMIAYSSLDRLILYAILMATLSVTIRVVYGFYCKRNFKDCVFNRNFNRQTVKEIFAFSGWNFIGASSGILRDQGVNILINIFCGPAVNAARGIATQVSTSVTQLSNNFLTAVNPQITKSYAQGERDYWLKLVFQGARLSIYLLLIITIPVFFEAKAILEIWLKTVPDHAVSFVRLTLICINVEAISCTLVTLMLATGHIRNYQIIVGGCQMLQFPIAYVLLRLGYEPEFAVAAGIIVAVGCLITRLVMLRRMVGFPVRQFLGQVVLNILLVVSVAIIVPILIVNLINEGPLRVLVMLLGSIVATCAIVYFIGCKSSERQFIFNKIQSCLRHSHESR